ncbi:MAG: hypothetical protein K6G42_01740 [Lachnospiraceae bacterium]|nr:hypothetical protein [Lachnospiraceae bacterium]
MKMKKTPAENLSSGNTTESKSVLKLDDEQLDAVSGGRIATYGGGRPFFACCSLETNEEYLIPPITDASEQSLQTGL